MPENLWIAIIILLPILLTGYWILVYGVYVWLRDGDIERLVKRFDWIYAPFIFTIGIAYTVQAADPVLRFDLVFLFSVPVGVGLYALTTVAWQYYTGAIPQRGERTLISIFPGLFVPFVEELLFRDGLAVLIDLVGPIGFVLVSSVVFGLHHIFLGLHEVVFKAALGVVLCAAFLWSGTVLVPALLHFGYNLGWVRYVTANPA